MKILKIKLGKERQCHITKQLVHSFLVNIRISQPSKAMFTSASPRWTSLFSGWQILMSTSKECIKCMMPTTKCSCYAVYQVLNIQYHWQGNLLETIDFLFLFLEWRGRTGLLFGSHFDWKCNITHHFVPQENLWLTLRQENHMGAYLKVTLKFFMIEYIPQFYS